MDRIDIWVSVGNVDYKKIPELKNVDLDQYRAKGYNKTTFRIEK